MKYIFDLDGTLITCKDRHCQLIKHIDSSINIDSYWKLKRSGLSNIQSLLKMGYTEDHAKKICSEWVSNIENTEWLKCDIPILNTKLLSILPGENIILTARKNKNNLLSQVDMLGFSNFFDEVICVNPTNAQYSKGVILSKLNASFFIGDTESDMYAANISNVTFYPVASGMRSVNFFDKAYGANNLKIYKNVNTILEDKKIWTTI